VTPAPRHHFQSWTPEQIALLRKLYAAGERSRVIAEAVSAIGPARTRKATYAQAVYLGLTRGAAVPKPRPESKRARARSHHYNLTGERHYKPGFGEARPPTTKRKCLGCGEQFQSWGNGNRQCVSCRARSTPWL
jgi:hypothetical protein